MENPSEHALLALLQCSTDCIYLKDTNSCFLIVSDELARRVGKTPSELMGKTDKDIFPSEHAEQALRDEQEIMNTGIPKKNIVEQERPGVWVSSSKWPWYDTQGNLLGLCGISRDITQEVLKEKENEELRASLAEAEKLKSMGQLCAKVAHDFRNDLTPIIGNLEWVLEDLNNHNYDASVIEGLKAAESSAFRAFELTKLLTNFAKTAQYKLKSANIDDIVCTMGSALTSQLKDGHYRLEYTLNAKRTVLLDENQFASAITNLVINARDAMATGGTIRIATNEIMLEETVNGTPDRIPAGQYVVFSVEDTGTGIKPEVMKNLFVPMVCSTKGEKGCGWGISSIRGIVKGHNGYLDISTEVGKGTTFSIYLPANPLNSETAPKVL